VVILACGSSQSFLNALDFHDKTSRAQLAERYAVQTQEITKGDEACQPKLVNREGISMRYVSLLVICSVLLGSAVPARADENETRRTKVSGKIVWTLIPGPNDAYGRVLGPVTGDLKGASSAIIRTLTPLPGGVLSTVDLDIFVLGPLDILIGEGRAVFTPIPGQPPGSFQDTQTITIQGGTGRFLRASGSLEIRGEGHNTLGGPGNGFFAVEYKGTVCHPNSPDVGSSENGNE